jgi:tetratricopeptide (TPR) repeat protein
MRSSDAHLEKALDEYNSKVSELEDGNDMPALLDAYINRGCVLSMLDSTVSAISDFDSAIDIIDELEENGTEVDPGCIFKVYTSRGELMSDGTGHDMSQDYKKAAEVLDKLEPGCRYYDVRNLVTACLTCAHDLIDAELPDYAVPFLEKALKYLDPAGDIPSRNRYTETKNLLGQALVDSDPDRAFEEFSDALKVADSLYTSAQLEDESQIVISLYFLGEICRDTDRSKDKYLFYREEAIRVMEEMKACGTLDDEELLSELHGEVAGIYMGKGDMATAEKHLLKQVSYNLNGSTEYMRDNGIDH